MNHVLRIEDDIFVIFYTSIQEPEGDWYCPECEKITVAECKETQSRSMASLDIDKLALHLRYALQRMKTTGVSVEISIMCVSANEFTYKGKGKHR